MTKDILESIKKEIKVEMKEKFNLNEFFKLREGLYVWDSFIKNVLEKVDSEPHSEYKVTSYALEKSATDEEIENSLPEQHIFSETNACAIIATLIEKQSKGEEGVLENTGYANLFYTPSHVVYVGLYGSSWYVRDWSRADGRWRSGGRVFSPATES